MLGQIARSLEVIGVCYLQGTTTGQRAATWRPPMPPLHWVNFDPTGVSLEAQNFVNQPETVGMSMLRGVEPSMVESEAKTTANFLEREVSITCSHLLNGE